MVVRTRMSRITTALSPYATNKNTGNFYEIVVALTLLRYIGITNEELDADNVLLNTIAEYNHKKTTELRELFANIRNKQVGTGLVFDGKRIVRIDNITQNDAVGGTGDLLLHTESGEALSLSVCEGKPKRNGNIEKCLTNPTSTRFGCTTEDCARFETIEQKAVTDYKAYMTSLYGIAEEAWKPRVQTPVATNACSEVAKIVEARFASLPAAQQKDILCDLLQIQDGRTPANYQVLVEKDRLALRFYKYEMPSVTVWNPRLEAKGIYLIVKQGEKNIGAVQVKFNNGVYHKGKPSSIHRSWNATFILSELFTMSPVTV